MKLISIVERISISMRKTKLPAEDRGITILRVALAILLGIHGLYRGSTGGTRFFALYLTETGFPLGSVIAWSITLFEIIGMVALLWRRCVIPVSLIFIFILATGIVLVHAREGWFVVGGGRNGVEYSVLLIASLIALIVSSRNAVHAADQ